MDYDSIINLLLDSIIGQSGLGRSSATVKLTEIVKHNPQPVINRVFQVTPSDQSTLVDCLRGIYDERIEKLANKWVDSKDNNLKMAGLFYLVSVDSEYAESCIKKMQQDKESHNRERAGIAAAKLLDVRLAKLGYKSE